jgi:hypothetical protein
MFVEAILLVTSAGVLLLDMDTNRDHPWIRMYENPLIHERGYSFFRLL